MSAPRIAVIVPTWNGWDTLPECLASIQAQRYEGAVRVVVVDDASTDGTADRVRARWPAALVLRLAENRGFAAACNEGMRAALCEQVDLILLVNDDAVLDASMLDRLVEVAEAHPAAALLNPLICYADAPSTVWSNGNQFSLFRALGGGADLGRSRAEVERKGIRRRVAATGCVLMVRAAVLREAGFLDDRFFMYYEDTEWSLRVRRAGYDILAVPQALAWHKIARRGPLPDEYSAFLYYYNVRNRLMLMAGHARWYHWLIFTPRFLGWLAFKMAGLTVLGRRRKQRAIVQAVTHFLCGRYPATKYEPGF